MTNDNDLIRRGDALAIVQSITTGHYDPKGWLQSIVALPAVADSQPADPVINAASRQRVVVKPLVWFEVERGTNGYGKWTAQGYTVRKIEGLFLLDFAGDSQSTWRFLTSDAAKAAAQADYETRILAAIDVQSDPRELTVWYGKMPESNGRENWTAILRPKAGVHLNGLMDGFCFARSEFPDRVRYEADRMRWIIGELTEKPHILAYDADLHSGYVPPPDPRDAQIARLVEALKSMLDGYQEWDMVGTTPVLRPNHMQTSWVQRANAALAAVKGGDA